MTRWVEKLGKTNWTAIAAVAGIVAIIFLISQTHSLGTQTRIMSEEFRVTYRPYLGVSQITVQEEGNGSSASIQIFVKNYGQVPATNVNLQKVIIGGADVIYDDKTGTYTFVYTGKDYVTPLIGQGNPPDLIFFPGKEQVITATVDKSTYQVTVSETKVMHIALEYSYGLERYYYLAVANLQGDTWKVTQDRGK